MVDVLNISTADVTPANNASVAGISILGTGLVSTADDSFRTIVSFLAKWWDDFGAVNTIGGTANAITITTPTLYTAFKQGIVVAFKNTGGPNTTAVTLNLDALGAKAIRLQGDSALVGGEMVANGVYLLRYDTSYNAAAGAWVLMNVAGTTLATNAQAATATSTTVALTPANLAQERGFSDAPFINFSIGTSSVAANALTIPFKGVDGNDHAAANPGYISFRSATAASGALAQLVLTSAQSLVVPSGASLGSVNAVATTYALAAFNNAGSIIWGIRNYVAAVPVTDGIATTTILNGSSTSADVWYTTSALTSKAYTIVAFFTATEATAGTWLTVPATMQVSTAPAVNNALPVITPWVTYASTFTSFGTVTGASIWSRRVGDTLQLRGYFTAGTPIAAEARMSLGFGGTSANVTSSTTKVPGLQLAGLVAYNTNSTNFYVTLIESAVQYITFGIQSAGTNALTKANGNNFPVGALISLQADIPIQGW